MKKAISTLLVTLLGLALLIYSGLRGLDFIMLTLPPDKQVLAFFALAATEGGILFWLGYFLYAANGGWQRGIALMSLVVDFLGSVALFTADTLLRSGESGLTSSLTPDEITTVIYALSGLIAINVAATLACHILDPENLKAMAQEDAKDKIETAALSRLSKDADQLAADLAPQLAADWIAELRTRLTTGIDQQTRRALPAPQDQAGEVLEIGGYLSPGAADLLDRAGVTWKHKPQPQPRPANWLAGLPALFSPLPSAAAEKPRTYEAAAQTGGRLTEPDPKDPAQTGGQQGG